MTKAEQIKGKFTLSITFLELSGRLLTRRRNSLTSETKSKIYNFVIHATKTLFLSIYYR